MTGAVISAQDISDLRRLEREVAERAQELEAIFETMTDGVFVYDAHGHITRVNAAGREILGPDALPMTARCRSVPLAGHLWTRRASHFPSSAYRACGFSAGKC